MNEGYCELFSFQYKLKLYEWRLSKGLYCMTPTGYNLCMFMVSYLSDMFYL